MFYTVNDDVCSKKVKKGKNSDKTSVDVPKSSPQSRKQKR